MNMNSNIKRGTSINGGVVLTDMPIETLTALRDAVDNAIQKYWEEEKDKYITDIQSAIDAVRDAGYVVFINDRLCEDKVNIEICRGSTNYYDDDEDEEEDDVPCEGCRDDCLHCPYC